MADCSEDNNDAVTNNNTKNTDNGNDKITNVPLSVLVAAQLQSWQEFVKSDQFAKLDSSEMKNMLKVAKCVAKDIKCKLCAKHFVEEHSTNPYAYLINSISTFQVEENENYLDTWKIKMKFPDIRIYISAQFDDPNDVPVYSKIWLTGPDDKEKELKITEVFPPEENPRECYRRDIRYFEHFVNTLSGFLVGTDHPTVNWSLMYLD